MDSRVQKIPPEAKRHMKRASRIVLLISYMLMCMIWLEFGFGLTTTGLQGLHASLEPKHESSVSRLEAFKYRRMEEPFVDMRLELLLELPLDRGHMFETHSDCLVRAANFADGHYLGITYHKFPKVLNHTVQWAQENCDRLSFTATAYEPEPRRKYFFGSGPGSLVQKAAQFCRWVGKLPPFKKIHSIFKQPVVTQKESGNGAKQLPDQQHATPPKEPIAMPPHFEINCFSPVCRLTATPSSPDAFVSISQIAEAQKLVDESAWILETLRKAWFYSSAFEVSVYRFEVMLILTLLLIPGIALLRGNHPLSTVQGMLKRLCMFKEVLIAEALSSKPVLNRFFWVSVFQKALLGLLFALRSNGEDAITPWLNEPCVIVGSSVVLVFFVYSNSDPPPGNIFDFFNAIVQIFRLCFDDEYYASLLPDSDEEYSSDNSDGSTKTDKKHGIPSDEEIKKWARGDFNTPTKCRYFTPEQIRADNARKARQATLNQDIENMIQKLQAAGSPDPSPEKTSSSGKKRVRFVLPRSVLCKDIENMIEDLDDAIARSVPLPRSVN